MLVKYSLFALLTITSALAFPVIHGAGTSNLTSGAHEFRAPQPGDSRSPCPAINALANHGHLPRDGKNVNLLQLVGALKDVYKVSIPLATILSSGGIYLCGHGMTLDLGGLRKHNAIEHDASMAHRDLDETGGTEPVGYPDPELVDAIIKASDGKVVTVENFMQVKKTREDRVHIKSESDYPNKLLSLGSRAEPMLLLSVMGESDTGISVERVKTFLGEERIPDDFVPRQTTGLLSIQSKTGAFAKGVDALHAQGRKA